MEEFTMIVGKKTSEMHDKQVLKLLKEHGIKLKNPKLAQQELKDRGYSVTIDEMGNSCYRLRLYKRFAETGYKFNYKFSTGKYTIPAEIPKDTGDGKKNR